MQPPRSRVALRTLLLVAMIAAGLDTLELRHAWATGRERVLVVAISALSLLAAAALAWLWIRAIGRLLSGRPLLTALVAAAPAAIGLGIALGETHLARARLGAAAPVVVSAGLLLAVLPVPRLSRLPFGLRAPLFGLFGLLLFAADAALPLRLYAPLRALLFLGGAAALTLALHRIGGPARRNIGSTISGNGLTISAWVPLVVAAALAGLLPLGAHRLLRRSANVRFIAEEQEPLTGLVLEGADLLLPSPRAPAQGAVAQLNRQRPTAEQAPGPLADADLLLITVDALRADRPLAHLDALAASGVRFARAYSQVPHTAFSISALLTSVYPERLHPTESAAPSTLAELLRARRWYTAAWYPAGLFFDGRRELASYATSHFGFEWADTRTVDAHTLTDEVLARVAQLHARGEPRAFLWAHYFDPHEPYVAHDGVAEDAPPLARYDSEVAYTDREIARLLAGLGKLSRPTLVVITADHGEEFGEHGGAYHGSSVYEEQVRVPLMFLVSGGVGLPAEVLSSPVELVDVAPTALALLDVPIPPSMEGASLVPDILDLEAAEPRDAHAEVQSRRMLVRGNWKLIHDLHRDVNQLYDLDADPHEARNRYDQRPDIAAPMHAALEQWFDLKSPGQLIGTLGDASASASERAAAAHALGEREIKEAAPALRKALGASDRELAAEAALALGALGDRQAAPSLNALLQNPDWRRKAALMLGRLRDRRAAPALLEAIDDVEVDLRRHAIHYLGFLGGDDALEPLEARALEDLKVRNEAYLAIGRLAARTGSRAAAAFLVERLAVEDRADARAHLAWALGVVGAAQHQLLGSRAIALLVRAAADQPPTTNAPEALVRIGAIAAGAIGGANFGPALLADKSAGASGFGPCRLEPNEARFTGISSCVQAGPSAELSARVPSGGPLVLLFRARALTDGPLEERISLDGVPAATVALDGAFRELRVTLPAGAIHRPFCRVALEAIGAPAGVPLAEIDHLLLLPAS
ncbi:MAG TPA: sulfatase-like hydrolase/transferase [Polyangia bacterium]